MAKAAAKTPAPKADTPAPAAAAAAEASTVKSIVNPKYKDAYKDASKKDWLSKFLDDNAMKMRDKTVTEKSADGEGTVSKTVQVQDGVDTDKLFAIAKANGIDTTKYEAQSGSHGFAGRMRMTLANMFRRVIKQRHGLNNAGGTFVSAPPEMLAKVGVAEGAVPTHKPDGTKITPPKAETPAPAADAKEPTAAAAPKGDGTKTKTK